jgi:hypothetical protein
MEGSGRPGPARMTTEDLDSRLSYGPRSTMLAGGQAAGVAAVVPFGRYACLAGADNSRADLAGAYRPRLHPARGTSVRASGAE